MRIIKFIWDFRGPTAAATAEHHLVHLKEFCAAENIAAEAFGTLAHNDFIAEAFVAASESYLELIRDRLKPHRASLYNTDSST
ncbi:MAG: hypothetical protein RQ756_06180 [Flavobacteriaceae bacterium]|nr:hypothetical protein [Flavobacteriaceae bacterium]